MDMDFAYCPVIKGKINDIKAMAFVAPVLAASVKPLFELPPFKPTDKPEEVLSRFAVRLGKLYSTRPCYVDFPLLKPGARTSGGELALDVGFGQLNAMNVQFEPVYGFDRDESLWGMVAQQALRSGGMLLRLDPDDLEFSEETVERIVDLRRHGLDLRLLDVMIDRRYVESRVAALGVVGETADFIERLVTATTVRKVLVAASSAPKTVAEIQKDGYGAITRSELTLWANLATERLPIRPIFGDYGVIHPDFSDLTMSTHINGKIRYTQGTKFHIHRGHSLRLGDKYEQYRKLSASVASSKHYQSKTFSYGDRYIFDCAAGHAGTGNPGTWVLVDQNHHISYALEQQQRLSVLVNRGLPVEEVLDRA
jgi:hypothetical protein